VAGEVETRHANGRIQCKGADEVRMAR
jgi:hypothetical protein